MIDLVDSHCHLDLQQYDADISDVVQRAHENNVRKILIPSIEIDGIKKISNLANQYKSVYFAIGVHPNSADTWDSESINKLASLSKIEKVVAVGEIGLDYYWNKTSHELQKNIFHIQLEFAKTHGLPVIIHTRESLDDTIMSLKNWQKFLVNESSQLAFNPGVVHSFSGNIDQAMDLIEHNFMIGITGPVTFKNAKELKELVKLVPLESLLIETDGPYLTPHPFRGKRNEPSYVKYVAEQIAVLKEIDIEQVVLQTTNNAKNLFKW